MIKLNYQIPITENANVNGEFLIQGTAINETITSNNHKFIGEELRKSADTLTGCPLLVDHENKVENIKGRVIKGTYDEALKCVTFKAKVMDKLTQEMIRDGRLNSVSVGAMVEDMNEEDGVLIPLGIKFKELSLVAVPADEGATFSIAMKEAYDLKKSSEPKIEQKIEKSESLINPENATDVVKEVQGEVLTGVKGGLKEMSEEKATETVVASDTNKVLLDKLAAMEAEISALKEASAKKKMEDEEEEEKKKSKAKSEDKADVVLKNEFEEDVEADVKEGYKIIQGNGFFSLVQNKY